MFLTYWWAGNWTRSLEAPCKAKSSPTVQILSLFLDHITRDSVLHTSVLQYPTVSRQSPNSSAWHIRPFRIWPLLASAGYIPFFHSHTLCCCYIKLLLISLSWHAFPCLSAFASASSPTSNVFLIPTNLSFKACLSAKCFLISLVQRSHSLRWWTQHNILIPLKCTH